MTAQALGYDFPEELEFFNLGFGLDSTHDPDETRFSFCYSYDDGRELIFTHSPSGPSVKVVLRAMGETVFDIAHQGIRSIQFQAWSGEKVARVYFRAPFESSLRVHFDPKPRLFFEVEEPLSP